MSESVAAVTLALPRNVPASSPGILAASTTRSRDVRRHRDLRLRLGDPLRILVDGREILDPGETAREVLVLEEDLRRRAVERILAGGLVERHARDRHGREQDDPPPALEGADGAQSRWVAVSTEAVHYRTPSYRPYPALPSPPLYPTSHDITHSRDAYEGLILGKQ